MPTRTTSIALRAMPALSCATPGTTTQDQLNRNESAAAARRAVS
jgi:hypothetical protein